MGKTFKDKMKMVGGKKAVKGKKKDLSVMEDRKGNLLKGIKKRGQ